ncbi:MAG: zf-HC2 domain-containing protein [Alphaproteobacteria bacterium]|nr:zf-HC2 domain-containing protein [Alphaproteobacteria bacterium]
MTTSSRSSKGRLARLMMKMPLMLTCREVEAFLIDYLEGTLPRAQRAVFDLHLRMCRECRDYLAAYRKSVELGRAAFARPEDPVGPEVPEDLVKAILDARSREG